MARTIFTGHVQHLVLGTTGLEPTIPTPPTATPNDPTWVDATDILIGEFAVNKVDDKVFYRSSNGIVEIGSGSGAVVFKGDFDFDATLPSVVGIKKGWQYRIILPFPYTPVSLDNEDIYHHSLIQAMMDDPGNDFTTGWLKIK